MKEQEAIELLTQERDNDIFAGTEHREKIHEAITMGIEALRFSERMHFNPYPEYNKLFHDVEAALGFELFTWQKTYIASGIYRRYGDTTAHILRRLLIDKTPLDLRHRQMGFKEHLEWLQTVDIYEKLAEAGIETCEVVF